MKGLGGKKFLITGAGRGLGRAIAERLAESGAHLALHYHRSDEQAEALATAISSAGGHAITVHGDVCKDAERIFDNALSGLNGLDGLVLNAGISKGAPLMAADINDMRSVLETNLLSAMQLTSLAVPLFLKQRYGRVVALSSAVAEQGGLTGQCAYAASKAGLLGFIKTLANELSPRIDFTANAVSPGVIPSDMSEMALETFAHALQRHIPLNRFGEPGDVAGAVAFLLSDEARYINGHNLVVDGGFSLNYVSRKKLR